MKHFGDDAFLVTPRRQPAAEEVLFDVGVLLTVVPVPQVPVTKPLPKKLHHPTLSQGLLLPDLAHVTTAIALAQSGERDRSIGLEPSPGVSREPSQLSVPRC